MFFLTAAQKQAQLVANLTNKFARQAKDSRDSYIRVVSSEYRKSGKKLFTDDALAAFRVECRGMVSDMLPQDMLGLCADDVLSKSALHQFRAYFAWDSIMMTFLFLDDTHAANIKRLYNHYNRLKSLIEERVNDINDIRGFQAAAIVDNRFAGVSFFNSSEIDLRITYFSGGNVFFNILKSTLDLLTLALLLIIGALYILPCMMSDSLYIGSAYFFSDLATHMVNTVATLVSSVIFPLAMIYSKYTTDSYNILKGETTRMLDSLEAVQTNHFNNAP